MYEPTLSIPLPDTCIDMAHDKSRNLIYILTRFEFHVYSVPSHKIIHSVAVRSGGTKLIHNDIDNTIIIGHSTGDISIFDGVSLILAFVMPSSTFSIVDLKVNKDTNSLYAIGRRPASATFPLNSLYVSAFDIGNSYSKLFSFINRPTDLSQSGHRFVTDFYYDDDTVVTTTTQHPLSQSDLYVVCSSGSSLEKLSTSTLTSSISKPLGANTFPQKIAIDKIRNKLFVTHYEANYISVHDISNLSATATTISLEEGIVDIIIDSTNNILYYINNISDKFVVYNIASSAKVFEKDLGFLPTSLSLDFANNFAYVANNTRNSLTKINITSFDDTNIFVSFRPFCIEGRDNSDILYIGDFDSGGVYKFDKISQDTIRLPYNFGKIFDLKYNSTTKILYVIQKNGDVVAFDTLRDRLVATLVNSYNSDLADGDTTLPSALEIDEVAGILYVANRVGNTISSYNLFNHTFQSIKDISDMPDGLLLDNRPTTTTTVAPVDVTLTIPDPIASDINNYVVFYGNIGDEIEYQDISPVSNTNDISEVVVFISGSVTNRITLPTEYVTNNNVFYLTVNSVQYTSSFGSGSLSSNGNYRRIDLP
tara:strand:+ start:24679 stop:26457 length:1779 start_codon:yes stop_codon:yes gene_type:complete